MIKITFVHEHETRRSSRYSETLPGDILRTLYVSTDALRQEFGRIPATLTIEINEKG